MGYIENKQESISEVWVITRSSLKDSEQVRAFKTDRKWQMMDIWVPVLREIATGLFSNFLSTTELYRKCFSAKWVLQEASCLERFKSVWQSEWASCKCFCCCIVCCMICDHEFDLNIVWRNREVRQDGCAGGKKKKHHMKTYSSNTSNRRASQATYIRCCNACQRGENFAVFYCN